MRIQRKSVKKYPFHLFSENADVSIFVEIQGQLSRKNAWLPPFFFVDSNSPCKDLLFPRGPNLAQKPLYLVGTVLKELFAPDPIWRCSFTNLEFAWFFLALDLLYYNFWWKNAARKAGGQRARNSGQLL